MNKISNEKNFHFLNEEIINDNILVLTLNRPDLGNTLSLESLNYLNNKLDNVSKNKNIHVVIFSSSGKIFCAGHDLKEINNNNSQAYYIDLFEKCSQLMMKIINMPQPVIAEVHGYASAAGCQLVATCDLAIASNESFFSTPGIKIGLFCSTPMVALTRSVNSKKSMEMLLTGDAIDANEALEIGLINRVVEKEMLKESVLGLAKKISNLPKGVLALGKGAFYKQINLPIQEAYKLTSEVMVENLSKKDSKEGIESFIQKKSPKWIND